MLDVGSRFTECARDNIVHCLKNKLDERARGIAYRRPLLEGSRRKIKAAVPPEFGGEKHVICFFRLGRAKVPARSMKECNAAASAQKHT